MNSTDWLNIAECANTRALAGTFSFDDDTNDILGELETREMARSQAYREAIIASTYMDITLQIAKEFDQPYLLDQIAEKKVVGISIQLLTE